MEETNQNQVKGRILQIYKYLQALDQLRNPVIRDIQLQPWSLWMKDLPSYPTIMMGEFEDTFSKSVEVSGWRSIVAIAAGSKHTIGLKSDGTVVAVGDNEYGQCDVSGWRGIQLPGN